MVCGTFRRLGNGKKSVTTTRDGRQSQNAVGSVDVVAASSSSGGEEGEAETGCPTGCNCESSPMASPTDGGRPRFGVTESGGE